MDLGKANDIYLSKVISSASDLKEGMIVDA
jgi:hypothetical protein